MTRERMIHVKGQPIIIDQDEVLRRWITRETPKGEYPDADPSNWDGERLIDELAETYDEPVEPATRGDPTWTSIAVYGSEVGKFNAYPGCGWDALSNDGTIGNAVDRLQREDLADDFPDATSTISTFKELYPGANLGAIVARQFDDEWPPVLLEGNHRATAAHWVAQEGASVTLEIHLAHEKSFEEMELMQDH
ncbi:MAG: hypothetical protein ABEI52_11250 [Halobacteriaceae archaeon]